MTDQTTSGAEARGTCHYASSRLTFRGPVKPIDGRHVAVLGGSETLARALPETYVDLLERALGETCVNFGQNNGSVEAMMHDTFLPHAAREATATVLAVTGAANLSNRLYSVHPRRNDRFVKASGLMAALYPGLDLSDVCFTRHLLLTLRSADPLRFESVQEELRTAWVARMRTFLDRVGPRVILLWFQPPAGDHGPLGPDPLFVTRRMVQELKPLVRETVVVEGLGTDPEAHARAAEALADPVRRLLGRVPLRAMG